MPHARKPSPATITWTRRRCEPHQSRISAPQRRMRESRSARAPNAHRVPNTQRALNVLKAQDYLPLLERQRVCKQKESAAPQTEPRTLDAASRALDTLRCRIECMCSKARREQPPAMTWPCWPTWLAIASRIKSPGAMLHPIAIVIQHNYVRSCSRIGPDLFGHHAPRFPAPPPYLEQDPAPLMRSATASTVTGSLNPGSSRSRQVAANGRRDARHRGACGGVGRRAYRHGAQALRRQYWLCLGGGDSSLGRDRRRAERGQFRSPRISPMGSPGTRTLIRRRRKGWRLAGR